MSVNGDYFSQRTERLYKPLSQGQEEASSSIRNVLRPPSYLCTYVMLIIAYNILDVIVPCVPGPVAAQHNGFVLSFLLSHSVSDLDIRSPGSNPQNAILHEAFLSL